MLVLFWVIFVYLGVNVTVKSLTKQEKDSSLLDR